MKKHSALREAELRQVRMWPSSTPPIICAAEYSRAEAARPRPICAGFRVLPAREGPSPPYRIWHFRYKREAHTCSVVRLPEEPAGQEGFAALVQLDRPYFGRGDGSNQEPDQGLRILV